MPVSRAFLYTPSRVTSKGALLQVALTKLPQRETLYFFGPLYPSLKVRGK
jgi:hypothetical protein